MANLARKRFMMVTDDSGERYVWVATGTPGIAVDFELTLKDA